MLYVNPILHGLFLDGGFCSVVVMRCVGGSALFDPALLHDVPWDKIQENLW